jgi:hypothetical protein
MNNANYMDVKMVSEYIHVSKSLVYRMVSLDEIPYIKIHSRTIFSKVQIDYWLMNDCKKVEDLPELPKL